MNPRLSFPLWMQSKQVQRTNSMSSLKHKKRRMKKTKMRDRGKKRDWRKITKHQLSLQGGIVRSVLWGMNRAGRGIFLSGFCNNQHLLKAWECWTPHLLPNNSAHVFAGGSWNAECIAAWRTGRTLSGGVLCAGGSQVMQGADGLLGTDLLPPLLAWPTLIIAAQTVPPQLRNERQKLSCFVIWT